MSETGANKFSYDSVPLSNASTSVRLLKLLPASVCPDGNLYGEIYTVTLSDAPKYASLSYAWGDNDRTHNLRVLSRDQRLESAEGHGAIHQSTDARLLPITLTLDICLRHLLDLTIMQIDGTPRDHSLATTICINQEDAKEKSCQVQIMGSIYSSADTTYAWLGPAADSSDEVMKAFFQLAFYLESFGCPGLLSYPTERDLLQQAIDIFVPLARERKVNIVCGRLVLHEEILSIAVDVFRGLSFARENANVQVPADLLERLVMLNSLPSDCRLGRFQLSLFGLRQWQRLLRQKGMSLLELLIEVSAPEVFSMAPFRSTQYRDRIYGLLGLAYDSERLGIWLDYTETTSTATVLTQTARVIIKKEASVYLLRYAQFPKDKVEDNDADIPLPSWVPDWSNERKESYEHLLPPPDDATLGLCGYLVDTINAMGIPWDFHTATDVRYCYYAMGYFAAFKRLQVLSEKNSDIYPRRGLKDLDYCRAKPETVTPAFQQLKEAWRCYTYRLREAIQNNDLDPYSEASKYIEDQWDELTSAKLYTHHTRISDKRSPYVTATKGYLGMAPRRSKVGDVVVIFCGDRIPYVIRLKGNGDNTYTFVGEAYCDGIMDGELADKLESERQDFYLV
ncbi:heterokaryon incompatibility protein-domain-containing protein [Sordaria sp. MPI-SDFR-AT-0083]|nr:heterokaryon incompatibility protein-domain-containing protein [Sordaria sp. MPI-SDFR-AT-0083]